MTKVKDTSLEAYKKLKDSGRLNRQQQQVLEFFMGPFKYGGIVGYNYHEVLKYTGIKSAQKRLNELEKKGLIKKVGVSEGCSTYQYVPDQSEQKARAKFFTERKPEIERYTAWLHSQRLKQHGDSWYGKVGDKMGEYTHKQLVKAFKQSEKLADQIIW